MRRSLLTYLALLALSACAPTRLTRHDRPEALSRTIPDPLKRDCGNLETARQYCGTAAKPGQPEPVRAATPCEKLYGAALRAASIQCGYEDELAYLHRAGEYSRTDYMADRIKQIHIKYNERAAELQDYLEDTYRALPGQLSDEEELTYQNVAWSLRAFRSRIRFDRPRSARAPASDVTTESLGRAVAPEETSRDLMKRLLVPKNRVHDSYETR